MRIAFATLLICSVSGLALAQGIPAFAKNGRIVTLEHWGRNEATVWAVQCDRVVAYEVFDTAAPDRFLVEVPITREQRQKISASVAAIPTEMRGRVYKPRGVWDGMMLRISFTPGGHFASDRVEVQNLWLPWLAGVTKAISEVMPEDRKLRFQEQVEERNRSLQWPADWPTDTITIDKYYEKMPNQSLEPTPKAVTHPADAGCAPALGVAQH